MTDPSIFGLDDDVSPEWHHGLPHCSFGTCRSYDGKRCEATGFRPSEHCEPALHSMRAWIEKARIEYAARCQEVHEETSARLRLTRERDEARDALIGARADAFRSAEEAVRSIADFFRLAGETATADHAVGAIHAAMDHDRWDALEPTSEPTSRPEGRSVTVRDHSTPGPIRTADQRLRKPSCSTAKSETYAAAGRSVVGSGEKKEG